MNKIKKVALSTGRFVERHKTSIAVGITAAVCLKLNRLALADHDSFLKEHNLLDKFYGAED